MEEQNWGWGVECCGGKTQGEGGEELVTVGNTVY